MRPIRSVLVVGGGIAGWLAADSCRRLIPGLEVTLVDDRAPADGVIDAYAGTRPPLRGLLERLGLGPAALIGEGGGLLRLGQRLDGWTGTTGSFLQLFGRCGDRVGRADFHQLWLRARAAGTAAPFAAHGVAAALADAGRFAALDDDAFDYAFALDPARFAALLRRHALAAGVALDGGELAAVELSDAGRIAGVRLADGRRLAADLFVDCTGPAARLLAALPGGDARDDWSAWLPCDRMAVATIAAADPPPLVDDATATPVGWRLAAPVVGETIVAHLHASAHATAERAARVLRVATGAGGPIAMRRCAQGRRCAPWIGNCLALGDAAATLEPLGAWPLHLLGRMVERMVALFPAADFDPVEIGEYNRRVAIDADHARDMVILPYALARRRDPFWREAARNPPPAVAAAIALFRERGRVPAPDVEDRAADEWLAAAIGMGVTPAQSDPSVEAVPPAAFDRAAAAMRARARAVADGAPTHARALSLLARA